MRRSAVLSWLAGAALVATSGAAPVVRAAETRIARPPEFVDRVNTAIDRGVQWLRSAQQSGGSFKEFGPYEGATTALAYLTMRVCGTPRDDAAAVRAFDAMRQGYAAARRGNSLKTYSAALFCMALAEHGQPTSGTDRSGERQTVLDEEDAAWMKELVKFLEDGEDAQGRWTYPWSNRREGGYDNSNTQYALLGLKAASRAGVKAHAATWIRALKHFLDEQEEDGKPVPRFEPSTKGKTSGNPIDHARGWGYTAGRFGGAYGSMTAGGVGSVVICRSELLGGGTYPPGLDAKAEQSARDGIAWLGLNFSVTTNPGPPRGTMAGPSWHYYYLYALERAGVLAGVDWMGEHDWYGEGADYLVREQLQGGGWVQGFGVGVRGIPMARPPLGDDANSVVQSCFALLFLKKGTAPVARGALTKDFDDSDINFAIVSTLSDTDFDDFLDLVLSRWRRAAAGDSKDRLFAHATAVGPRIIVPLVMRLSSTKRPEREAAFALLQHATGIDNGYDPGAAPDVRDDAVVAWQTWWLANEKSLRYDATIGRIAAAK